MSFACCLTHILIVEVVQRLAVSVSFLAFQKSKIVPGRGITNSILNWNPRVTGSVLLVSVCSLPKPELWLVPKAGLWALLLR